jgi:hypothetical protein
MTVLRIFRLQNIANEPILTCSPECWILGNMEQSRIEELQMGYLQLTSGLTRKDNN